MEIEDDIYGKEKIEERVLVELINSDKVQRLKSISQFGIPEEYYTRKGFSRFEHSIGVLILLRRLGADLDEQIAGLLHDVSHTAFSHLVDWIVGDPDKEDYHDNIFEEILVGSKIPQILEKYGFKTEDFFNLEKFPLLEKEAPSLCADRVDYTLREISISNNSLARELFKDLISHNNQIVFKSKEKAKIFAKEYNNLQKKHWAAPEEMARWYFMSWILRKALNKKIISKEDFYQTDEYVLNKLLEEESFSKDLKWLKEKFDFSITEKNTGIQLRKKFRYIDPEFLSEGNFLSLSEHSEEYKDFLEKEKQNASNLEKIIFHRN